MGKGLILRVVIVTVTLFGCGRGTESIVRLDGSSTVFPINEAVAEAFQESHEALVTIGVSGTGGGFQKFCRGEIAIAGASRPIQPTEVDLCSGAGVDYIELPIAYDGIAVTVHPSNDWVDYLTVDELRRIWQPEAQRELTHWDQVRTAWPEEEIHLFGPGVDSGTYDYFTRAIVGEEHASRGDYTSSEDDNVLVHGVANDRLALGYFGYAYYVENQERLKVVPVDDQNPENGEGPVAPSPETVARGTYQPLSRPLFIYIRASEAARPEVESFVDFYIDEVPNLVPDVGYIALSERGYRLVRGHFEERKTGSAFGGEGSRVGVTVEEVLGESE